MFHKHELVQDEPLTVSGYGLTEYKLWFCRSCGELLWKLTVDYDNLYPKLKNKKKWGLG